ncbi:MAG: hypothetical protein ACLTDR_04740 [Adlercreutzia equolifaciens]
MRMADEARAAARMPWPEGLVDYLLIVPAGFEEGAIWRRPATAA